MNFFYLCVALIGGTIATGTINNNQEIKVYIASNGIHTDICMPTLTELKDWTNFISTKPFETQNKDYIKIGWGDKGFFLDTPTWSELKASTAINAALLPSNTAMHVAYIREPQKSESCRAVTLNFYNYKKLINHIESSFETRDRKILLIHGKGYSNNDNFYEAINSYHLFRTCNSWTNEALKSANVKTGIYALFPHGILSHLPEN